jgi:hypothetical protein
LVEPFQLTYGTRDSDSTLQDEAELDPHRLLRKFMKEYKERRLPGYVKLLEELGMPIILLDKLVFKNDDFKATIDGYVFLMTLYVAFAKIYRNTRQDAEEVEIMDYFYFVIQNKFEGFQKDGTQGAQVCSNS